MSRRLLRSHRLVFAVTGGLAAGALLMPVARAQSAEPVTTKEADSASAEKKAEKKSERIQVTGSRIKRTEVEGVSSIIQIDQETIQKSGTNSVGELLQQMSVSVDGSYSSSLVNDTRGTVTNVNLRGLGPENTLVLLDGRRLPDEGGMGIVDLSMIPMAAVERIEVLKDSASAIYGSDATGGVVNIITKKDFEGQAVFARASKPTGKGGDGTTLSYVSGTQVGNLHVLAALSYKHSEPVFWRDRDWTKDGVSTYSSPANVGLTTQVRNPDGSLALNADGTPKTNTAYYGAPNCTTARFEDGQCSYNYAQTMAIQPETSQLGFLSNIDYRINDHVQLYSTLRAQQNQNTWNMAPNAGAFDVPASTLALKPGLNLSGLELAAGSGARVKYRSVAWGNRVWEETNKGFGGNVGLRGDLGQSWEWNVSGGRAQSHKESRNPKGFFLKDLVTDSIANGNFNPLETNLADPALAAIVNQAAYEPHTVNKTSMNTYDANFTGPLFTLPGGNAAMAVGASRFDQTYDKDIDDVSQANNVFGVTDDKSGKGDRTVNAVYAEIDLPVLKELELQAAVRHDQYSDFGSTTNPKAGFKFKPVDSLLVRGNVGTGFKAPTLNQIYNTGSIEQINLYDTPNLANQPDRQDEIDVETYGNKDLKQETSLSWNAGVVVDPIEGLSLTADYWYLKINDIIRPVDAQRALDAAAEGQPLPGITIEHVNNDPTGPLSRIRVPTANLGKSEDAGVDTSAEYRFRAGGSRFLIGSDYSRKIYSKTVPYPGADQRNVLGERGHPYWKMVNTGGWNIANHGITLRNNIISKMKKTPTPELTGTLSSYSTYDAQYVWNHPWNGSIAIGALNLANKEFPKDDTERVGDDQRVAELYPTDGRVFYVNLNQTF